MRGYELMYIINPTLEEEAVNGVVEKFKTLVETHGGEIAKLDRWGKRRLAYEIDDLKEGYYVLCNFNSKPEVAHELDRVMKITDEIIRHMIIRNDQ